MKRFLFLLSISFFILSCNNENDKTAKESVKTYLKTHALEGVKYEDNGFGKLYAVGTSDEIEKAFNINEDKSYPEKSLEKMGPMFRFLAFRVNFLSSGSEAYEYILKNAIFCDSIIEKNKFTPNQYVISHKFTLKKKDGSEIKKEMIFRLDSTMHEIKGIKERSF